MPVVVLVALFSGLATSVEAAALTAAYALFTQSVIHRDLSIRRDLLRVFAECVGLIGGVLVILGVAVGLTNWLVGAQVPMHLVEFTRAHIASRVHVPAGAERVSAAGRLPDGDFPGDRRGGAAHRAARRWRSTCTRCTWASSSSPTSSSDT